MFLFGSSSALWGMEVGPGTTEGGILDHFDGRRPLVRFQTAMICWVWILSWNVVLSEGCRRSGGLQGKSKGNRQEIVGQTRVRHSTHVSRTTTAATMLQVPNQMKQYNQEKDITLVSLCCNRNLSMRSQWEAICSWFWMSSGVKTI